MGCPLLYPHQMLCRVALPSDRPYRRHILPPFFIMLLWTRLSLWISNHLKSGNKYQLPQQWRLAVWEKGGGSSIIYTHPLWRPPALTKQTPHAYLWSFALVLPSDLGLPCYTSFYIFLIPCGTHLQAALPRMTLLSVTPVQTLTSYSQNCSIS